MGLCMGIDCLRLATLAVTCTVNLPFVEPGGWILKTVTPAKVCIENIGDSVGPGGQALTPDCSKGSSGYYDPCQMCKDISVRSYDDDGTMFVCTCGDSLTGLARRCPYKCPPNQARVRLEKYDKPLFLKSGETWGPFAFIPPLVCIAGEPLEVEIIP